MRNVIFWILAVVITVALSVYQRMTGPTYPKKIVVELAEQTDTVVGTYRLKLPRSGVRHDETVALTDIPSSVTACLHYRCYPTDDSFTTVDFSIRDGVLQATLPMQPVGGKLQYYITVDGKDYPSDGPVIIRFRNDVPAVILVPHILLMFGSMLLAVYTLLLVLAHREYRRWLKAAVAMLFVGGFVLGPLVQHVAFGPWWTGFPYGWDLTDNKTLLAFLFFMAALATLKWKHNRWVVALAVLLMIAVFTIPHSAYGSEYDYETQQLGTAASKPQ